MRPDPASRFQPEGVRAPHEVVPQRDVEWTDDGWRGLSRLDLVFYEIHVGTFTPDGTFDSVIPWLHHLNDPGSRPLS
jgi:maltooligosyltrehalose trehalohydrolase